MSFTCYDTIKSIRKIIYQNTVTTRSAYMCMLIESFIDEGRKVGFDCGLLHVLHSC